MGEPSGKITVKAWRCRRCAHVWLADPVDPVRPRRCARCKKFNWWRAARPRAKAPPASPPSLRGFARKYVWWKTAEAALRRPDLLISRVMDDGTFEDMEFRGQYTYCCPKSWRTIQLMGH